MVMIRISVGLKSADVGGPNQRLVEVSHSQLFHLNCIPRSYIQIGGILFPETSYLGDICVKYVLLY